MGLSYVSHRKEENSFVSQSLREISTNEHHKTKLSSKERVICLKPQIPRGKPSDMRVKQSYCEILYNATQVKGPRAI